MYGQKAPDVKIDPIYIDEGGYPALIIKRLFFVIMDSPLSWNPVYHP
jgi:hypothetical protein